MEMILNREALKQSLIRHEGIRYAPYKDTEGYWTIGVGHKMPVYKDTLLSVEEVMSLLDADIDHAISKANQFSWFSNLDDTRQAVIVEMIFQLGYSGVSKFKNMIAAIQDQDYSKAADEMLDSKWYWQTPNRCLELSGIMRG